MTSRWTLGLLIALAACSEDAIVTIPPTGTPTQLAVTVQPSSSAQSGVALAQGPVVRLKDAGGNASATAGVVVTVSGPAGLTFGGSTTATTDGSGTARFNGLILYGLVGNYALHFTSGSLAAADAQAVVLAAGPLARVKITTQPSAAAVAGVALAQQPVVQLRDVQGNAVARSGVTVTAVAVLGQGAAVTNATTTTNGAGQATFAGLTVGGAAGPHLLIVTAAGAFLGDTSTTITLSAGPATQLALTTQPAAASQSGVALPTQPVVRLQDAWGNNVSQAGIKVAASLISAGGASVQNDTALTNATGTATYGSLKISGLVGNYTFRFVATSYTSAVASAATVLAAGPAFKVKLTTPPPGLVATGQAFGTQPVAVLQDSAGNPVAQSGVTVTAGFTTAQAPKDSLVGKTALTDATGKATFTSLALFGVSGQQYAIQFSAAALKVDSSVVSLQPGSPPHLAIRTPPSTSATNALALGNQPAVELRDVSDNLATLNGFTITATLTGANSGNAVVSGSSAITGSPGQSGVASFQTLTVTGLAALGAGTNYTLRFSEPSLGFVDSPTQTNLVPGTATKLALTTQPSTSATSGVALAQQPVVQLQDVSGNATATPANVQITAGVLSGSVTISNGTVFTGAGTGTATFTNLTLTASPGSYTLIFSAGALTAIQALQATQVN